MPTSAQLPIKGVAKRVVIGEASDEGADGTSELRAHRRVVINVGEKAGDDVVRGRVIERPILVEVGGEKIPKRHRGR